MQAKSDNGSKEISSATAGLILDVAEELLQTRGFNAISYQDISDRVGIRKASIHHHFRAKAGLAAAVVRRYRGRWSEFLAEVDETAGGAWARLDRYLEPFRSTARHGDRACLCGVLGAEFASLAPAIQTEVRQFFADNETWIARLLEEGRRTGEFDFAGDATSEAGVFFACLEGTLLVARACADPRRFYAVVAQLKAGLGPGH